MDDKKDTEGALKWIVGLFNKYNIPFQIAGGFAARLYGSIRPLADIDIGIPDKNFDDIYPEVKKYITFGPAQYKDKEWDLRLMTLKYKRQEIDICGEDTIKYFDHTTGTWIQGTNNFAKSELKEIYELRIPVIPKADLIAYKKRLMREVDIADLQFLEA